MEVLSPVQPHASSASKFNSKPTEPKKGKTAWVKEQQGSSETLRNGIRQQAHPVFEVSLLGELFSPPWSKSQEVDFC